MVTCFLSKVSKGNIIGSRKCREPHLSSKSRAIDDVTCLLPVFDEGVEGRRRVNILQGGRDRAAPGKRHPQRGVSQPAGHPVLSTGGTKEVEGEGG